MGRVIQGEVIVAGAGSGPLLVTDQALSFWGGYDQLTGEIIDRRHPLSGRIATGSVLALPASRGSSTTSAVFLEAAKAGTAPAAIITIGPDRFLALASIVADEVFGKGIPMVAVSAADFGLLVTGTIAVVSPDGRIELGSTCEVPSDETLLVLGDGHRAGRRRL